MGRLRVLIVDDNPDAVDMLETLVQAMGHETDRAHDGQSALAAVERFRPEAVLLDIGMPGMDGYQVAREIRRMPNVGRVLLIALTGWGGESDRERAREAGFDHHVTKPADPDLIDRLLASRDSGR